MKTSEAKGEVLDYLVAHCVELSKKFPIFLEGDNISRDEEGRFWVALFAPRKAIVDRLAPYPALRKAIVRIPAALQPKPARYAHLIAIDEKGRVLDDRQDPAGGYAPITDVLATDRWLYLGSLSEPTLARVPR